MPTDAYRIENLDVYRRSVSLATRLYQEAEGPGAVEDKIRECCLSFVMNLASGLGFWEKNFKVAHFSASKRGLMELNPLLELMVALGNLTPEKQNGYSVEIQDLAKLIQGLLRQANRREEKNEKNAG